MNRVAPLPGSEWDPELCRMFTVDQATPLEQGAMRMFARNGEPIVVR